MFYLVADDRSLSLSIYWFDSDELFSVFFYYSEDDYEKSKACFIALI